MRLLLRLLGAAAMLLLAAQPAAAEPTRIDVRVIARGAKFLGGYTTPVRVALTDADTGETLARGVTSGTTGDTQRIVADRKGNSGKRSSADAAVFRTTLDIERPRRITATVIGPLSQAQATTSATNTQWVLPGHDVTAGDGWLIELPGLIVDVADPIAYRWVKASETVPLRAGVTMLCGCAISQDGPWRASDTEVEAIVTINGGASRRIPLRFDPASATSTANIGHSPKARLVVMMTEVFFVELADQMEQQLPARAGERQVAQFVEDHDVEPAELGGHGAGLADTGLFLEAGDEVDGVEVAPAGAGTDDAGGDCGGQMGLAGPRTADEHDIAPTGQEGASVERTHRALVDRGALEHEGIEILDHRQLGRSHAVADRGGVAMRSFRP